ncbi:MAG: hypothetical protein COB16_10225 [Rhodobacteraceae bacterium]|nr:MAG: hypothetical protein COB16_10225 [Paracoccaceae bacterium]
MINGYREEAYDATIQLMRRQAKKIEETRGFLMDLAQTSAVIAPSEPTYGAFLAQFLPLHPKLLTLGSRVPTAAFCVLPSLADGHKSC